MLEIQRAEIKRPRLTHEVVEAWLRSFRVGDVTDDDFHARLVDTFITRVELRNDEALMFYNIREKGPHSRVRVRPEGHRAAGLCRPQNCRIKQKSPGGCRGSLSLSCICWLL